ncbi:putative tRNA acetyltransferase NDAI_0I03160 [Naumovozyma dairenensis CBS 421]|uniref:THUMP domain-containing protein n=1 Tax=Naumovozyma dairenensis (strain ATCC 10597 / BCRC 20456 / CBS 421 / NBRC 0211 / NRRL Y-12639) TaxID=1071378 RepID=G0WGH3_NAUDC|nr:hypothetical protein NDAI_0I03160 [Naumovozyma dairenensis CBS 421]CCD26884.1 hypothetical protein NDAI_0I03160 [Naumovozyma dairenensis CBS 421]
MSKEKRSHDGGNNNNNNDRNKKRKFKVSSGFLDPGTSGIYATCARRKERQAAQELGLLFEEKLEEIYKDELAELDAADDNTEEGDNNDDKKKGEQELSIEDQIKQELSELKDHDKKTTLTGEKKKDPLQFIDLDCECVIFCKTRKPIVPEEFLHKIIESLADPTNMEKRTRYVQKLTPITYSCSGSMDQLIKLAQRVLAPHFHNADNPTEYKFAVEVSRRNFNSIPKMDIIKQVVIEATKGGELGHKVDLKNYDKLILIECFKNNIGMSVVDGDYSKKYRKYNVQQIYEAKFNDNHEEDANEEVRT